MRIPALARKRGTSFDITPMIDVVFNLVIFFLVASHFARNEASEPVELPVASRIAEQAENPHRLIVTVLPTGELSVGGAIQDLLGVQQMIAEGAADHPGEFAVHIRADRAAPYQSVEPIMEACARKGVTRVAFKVVEQ
jgi:biopolymer transport protein ExbD